MRAPVVDRLQVMQSMPLAIPAIVLPLSPQRNGYLLASWLLPCKESRSQSSDPAPGTETTKSYADGCWGNPGASNAAPWSLVS
jgi:hypothetical protein